MNEKWKSKPGGSGRAHFGLPGGLTVHILGGSQTERWTAAGILFKKYQSAFDCCSRHKCGAENGLRAGGKAEGALGAGCGQGQPFLPQSPPQSFFFLQGLGSSVADLQQPSVSFLTAILQQSAPLPQAKTAVVGVAEKANTNRNGSDIAFKTRIM